MFWSLQLIDGAESHPLASFYPSLDQKFFLHFFEQFAVSHSPISADSTRLAFASHPNPKGGGTDTTSHICTVNLDGSEPNVEILAPGDFAVFSP